MDQQYPTVAKISILDTGKFEQWQFRIQQYLQHEHYALWEVIEFEDSYEVPTSTASTTTTDTTSYETGKKSVRTVTLTAEDMQKKKNDVKARTTLLLSLPDEHQLRFSKYKTARELWAAILKPFGGNETTKKTKKNLLKQQLQVIVGQLQFVDVKIEQDDLNQKFLISLAPEWLMHTIVWRNRSDLDTMSLDDFYNHLKVYESEVQKKSEPNSQNMAFISSAKPSSGNKDANTACVPTASTNVPTASTNVPTANIDEDDMEEMDIKWNMALLSMRADKFWKKTRKKISIQGSDMAGFDKSKVECFNCHKMGHFARECRAPRSQDRGRRDNYRQGSKAKEQAPKALMAIDGTGLSEFANDTVTDYSKPSPTIESASGDDQNRNPSVSETVASPITPKPFIKFVKSKDSQSKSKTDETKTSKKPPVKYAKQYRKPNKKPNVRGNQKNWNNLKSQQLGPDFVMKKKACFNCGDFNHLAYDCRKRVKKSFTPKPVAHRPNRPPVRTNMNGARPNRTSFNKHAHSYANRPFHRTSAVRSYYRAPWVLTVNRNFPPVNRKFSTGSRNFPTANRKFPTASRKFPAGSTKCSTADMGMKGKAANDSPTKSKTNKVKIAKKPPVNYDEQHRKPTKNPTVRGNKRNWNNLKSHQLGPNFGKKKACFNCGDFDHLAYDC
nr:hypothetical protein [Tanacetum cinerariifolium]